MSNKLNTIIIDSDLTYCHVASLTCVACPWLPVRPSTFKTWRSRDALGRCAYALQLLTFAYLGLSIVAAMSQTLLWTGWWASSRKGRGGKSTRFLRMRKIECHAHFWKICRIPVCIKMLMPVVATEMYSKHCDLFFNLSEVAMGELFWQDEFWAHIIWCFLGRQRWDGRDGRRDLQYGTMKGVHASHRLPFSPSRPHSSQGNTLRGSKWLMLW